MTAIPPLTRLGSADLAAPVEVARLLAETVAAAGAIALGLFRSDLRTWNKQNDSPVTEADIAVDRFLRAELGALAPDYGWLSEESIDGPDRLARQRVWVVDPIDGTRAYLEGRADWAVSVALVESGRPIVGVLFAPVTGEMMIAARGAGATRNASPMVASAKPGLDQAAVSGPGFLLDRLADVGLTRMPRVRSLALRLARVATAELDVSLASANSHDWDIAAADLLVHEAGGALTGYDGAVPVYNASVPRHGPLVCAGPHLHAPMLALIRDGIGVTRSLPNADYRHP
ncbi:3'(2'),5'-bisphosphate nucleotidase CysQ [Aquabacter spiritensis]|uniref:Myo-inositol-1(Or 4)-monophosphatase n=1 Tax=Aquabacter spiritensis TaxID=933073 RepID=A0A4R3LQZ2_9HYPH|nr:3'(2'),5'-bisphosphate nucleotidase CysQ [Aquabacter spiritensis]TCT02923.1 myo-inositol-1(or 4)-monophosphatase [Aquabacter spiritensis]